MRLTVTLAVFLMQLLFVQTAMATRINMVELTDSSIFIQIDSIVQSTDLNKTLKPEYRIKLEDYDYFEITRKNGSNYSESSCVDEYWLDICGYEEKSISGEYFMFKINSRPYLSLTWDKEIYRRHTDTIELVDGEPDWRILLYTLTVPRWRFKIRDNKVVQALYCLEEADDFQEVVYDLLKGQIVSEGSMWEKSEK